MSGTIRAKYFRCMTSFNLYHPLMIYVIIIIRAAAPYHVHYLAVLAHLVLRFCTFYKTGRAGPIIF